MNAPILKRVEALEGRGTGGTNSMLVIVNFLAKRDIEPDPVGIEAAPPHFPTAVDRLTGENWDAFTKRLTGMLSHMPAGGVVLAFAHSAGMRTR